MYKSKSRYFKRSRISDKKIREIIKYFSTDLTIALIAESSNIHRNTVFHFVNKIKKNIQI